MANIAPNSTNVLAATRIWMCRLTFDPPARSPTTESSHQSQESSNRKTMFDQYMDGMHIVPLSEAYVMLITTSTPTQSISPNAANALFCRTSKNGELLTISEGEIGAGVPNSEPSRYQLFCPETSLVYYWTLSKERFKRVVREARADYQQAKQTYDFGVFKVVPEHVAYDPESLFELLEPRSDHRLIVSLLRHTLMRIRSDVPPGYVKGYDLKVMGATWNTSVNRLWNYVFAERRVADALYCGELAQYHALGLWQRSAEQFAIFSQVRDICHRSKDHERVEELDRQGEHQLFRDVYYEYAYSCARDPRVERSLFLDAIDVAVLRDDWKKAAIEIARITDSACIHPCMDLDREDPRWQFRPVDVNLVMHYFDYYRFGTEAHVLRTVSFAHDSELAIRHQLGILRGQVASLMAAIYYYDLLVCLGNYPDQNALDKKVHERYLDLSVDVYHPWWKTFEPENDSAWKKLKPMLEDTGAFADKSFGFYSEHFDNLENIEKYNHMLKGKANRIKRLANQFIKWNHLVAGNTVDLKRGSLHVEADLAKGILTVKEGSKDVAQMRLLLTEVTEESSRVPISKLKSNAGKVRFRQVKELRAHFDVEPPFKELQLWPAWFGVFGQVLSLAISTREAADKLSEKAELGERFIAVAKVTKDGFEIIDSLSAALRASFAHADGGGKLARFAKVGEKFRGPGLVLEALLNLHEGMTIILLGDDSASASLARRGEFVEATIVEYRGLVLAASAVPGAVAAGSAMVAGATAAEVMLAAIPPLGLALAIAGVAVVVLDIAYYIYHGPAKIMDPIDDALDKAKVKEFGNFFDQERTLASLTRFSKTVDLLVAERTTESVWHSSTQ